jgi:isochorismate hydrolase
MTDEVNAHFSGMQKSQVILCGIESHVCVMQTAMDLLESGVEVHLVCDAVSSQRYVFNHNIF